MDFLVKEKYKNAACVYIVGCYDSPLFYIGATANARERFINHKSELKNKKHYREQLQKLSDRFGLGRMFFKPLEFCDKSELEEKEQHHYDLNKHFCLNVRNIVNKNTGTVRDREVVNRISSKIRGRKMSSETIEKMRISSTGRKHTEFSKAKISSRAMGNQNGKGHVMPDELKAKIKAKVQLPVSQYGLNGIFIKEWVSSREAARQLGISYKNIPAVIKGKRKHAGGFIWKR